MWRERVTALTAACILYLSVPAIVWAQATAQISGTARDASAAVLKMEVGEVAQSVEVQSDVAQVETRKVGVGTIVENTQRILDLPLNGRQPTDLISLGGAAVVQNVAPAYTINGGVQISVAGGTSFSVQYSLDGASHLDTWFGQNMPLPFPDALQEFRLSTSTQDASEGGAPQLP